ncbi:MAG: heavy-metal-associated domain-containing protein [Ignavibacteriaceae bacterium]|jgi:copper chaperone CopZ
MTTKKLNIEGMSCQHCVHAVKSELSKLDVNVKDVQIGSAEVEFDEQKIKENDLKTAVENAGYKLV